MNETSRRALRLVDAWTSAVNEEDVELVLALCSTDVELVGPRGTATGEAVLRDWLGHAGISLQSLRTFARETKVVVEQAARWRAAGAPGDQVVATAFTVREGLISQIARYDDLQEALNAAGLTQADAVPGEA
jgi:ketosteroid isomerase-like protein